MYCVKPQGDVETSNCVSLARNDQNNFIYLPRNQSMLTDEVSTLMCFTFKQVFFKVFLLIFSIDFVRIIIIIHLCIKELLNFKFFYYVRLG